MNNYSTSNMPNEHFLLVNILNTMYNENNSQIRKLTQQNNQILNTLTNILYTPLSTRRHRYQNNRNNINNTTNRNNINNNYRNNINNTSNRNNINNTYRSLFNNTPYIIDNVQRYTIPTNSTPINSTSLPDRRTPNSIFSNLVQTFLDPVIIHPTHSQIEIATRRVRYSDILNPINRTCPISMDTFNDNDTVTVIRFCGHIFNTEQLNTWFQSNCRCPVCRYDIRNYNSNNSNVNYNNEENTNNNNTFQTLLNENQTLSNLFQDLSGNIIFDSTDPYTILNLFNNIQS